jgi:uncharacterized protein (DUF58 family)
MDLFAYVFIDASASMGFPTAAEKFLPATHIAAAIAYVVLANQDHVKMHLLQGSAGNTASPFYRGRRRIADCINFASSLHPAGTLEMAPALADHLRRLRRPGKAIFISDFLVPPASCQQALNLLRGFNLDISAIQVLSRQEVDPSWSRGSLALVDSESQAEARLEWNANVRAEYQARLAQHNLQIRSFCHQSGIHYSLYVTDRDLGGFILATLPAIGLFK